LNTGNQNAGCGKCPEGDFVCYDCNESECNSKNNYDKAFKCYESNGKMSEIKGSRCNQKSCYLASTIKG